MKWITHIKIKSITEEVRLCYKYSVMMVTELEATELIEGKDSYYLRPLMSSGLDLHYQHQDSREDSVQHKR